MLYFISTLYIVTLLYFSYFCLRSRPVDPDAVCPLVSQLVSMLKMMILMTEWLDDGLDDDNYRMTEWQNDWMMIMTDDKLTGWW